MNYLSSKSLETVLPDYEQVFRIIQDIRNTAQNESYEMEEYEHIPYRNVVSIWGERGSGKTSVFMTLRNALMGKTDDEAYKKAMDSNKELKGDCHLSLIVPEMLEEGTDLLGVILLKIKKEIENKKKEHPEVDTGEGRNEQFESCIYKKKDELDTLWDEAFATYLMRAEGYNSIASKNYTNFYDYSKQREESLRSEINLREKIYKLFTKISERFRNLNEKSLIFVYIDDADINRLRCAETVNTILRYLKHPNVVVFLSGDKDKMERELLWYELKDVSVLQQCSKEMMESVKATKKQYVYDLLKKVVPYSGRFYLQKLKNAKKKELIYPAKTGEKVITFGVELQQLFHLQEEDFDKLIPNSVFGIFDYKPRGIITVWDYIRNEFGEDSIMKASSLLSFLDKIIITNDYLKDHEKIIKDCVDLTQAAGGCKCHINYEMFRYYVYSKVQSVEVEDSETEKKKLMIQEQLIDVLQLFYFMEKLVKHSVVRDGKEEFDKENDDGLGARYAELLNAILDIKDERRVYYNALTAVEVITLYDALSSVLSLKQQSEIYKSKELFVKYKEILGDLEYKPLKDMHDYEWKQTLDKESELNNNTNKEILSEVLRAFQGVEFDRSILEVEEERKPENDDEIKKVKCDEKIGFNFNKDTKLRDMVDQLIKMRKKEAIVQNIVIREMPEIKDEEIEGSVSIKRSEIGKTFIARMNYLLDETFLQSIKYYIEPDEEIFMSNCRVEYKRCKDCIGEEKSTAELECNFKERFLFWNADRVVSILNIIRTAAKKRRKDLDELDLLACANILNKLEKGDKSISIFVNKEFLQYLEILKNSIPREPKNRAEELVKEFCTGKCILSKREYTEKIKENESTEKKIKEKEVIIKTNTLEMFNDNQDDLDIACRIDESKNEDGSWKTRRKNTMYALTKMLENIYIEQKCNELLLDFGFINYVDMLDDNVFDVPDCCYKDIQNYIEGKVAFLSTAKNNYLIQQGITFVKQQVINEQEYYMIHEINLESLDEIIRKSGSIEIRMEAETVKQRLLVEGKINVQTLDEFVGRLEFYFTSRLDKDNSFLLNTLKLLCKKLIKKDEPIVCAEKLIDIEKEERKRIYQLELNSYVRAYKNHLEGRISPKQVKFIKNPTQEA